MAHVLVIETQPSVRLALRRFVEGRGHTCTPVINSEEAVEAATTQEPDLVLVDGRNLDLPACEFLRGWIDSSACIVSLEPGRDLPPEFDAVDELKRIDRPIDFSRLGALMQDAFVRPKAVELTADADDTRELVWQSEAMAEVDARIERLAAHELPVLITGESGTGKELVARALHQRSPRSNHPFLAVHCGAIPAELLESELFGHEKGSFTDAHRTHVGRFEAAGEGTLMLDEIGEMPAALQVKLLRVLQEREITRVGAERTIRVRARILAATHRDLDAEVKAGRFRLDLYHRLAVAEIWIPPLRERQGDLRRLAAVLLARLGHEYGRRISGFTRGAVERLEAHSWPGNVRELENVLRRAVVMESEGVLERRHLDRLLDPAEGRGTSEPAWAPSLRAWMLAGKAEGRSHEALRAELLAWIDREERGESRRSEGE